MKEKLERWETIGLLQAMPEDLKKGVVENFDYIADYVLSNKSELSSNVAMETTLFPMIFRITKGRNRNISEAELKNLIPLYKTFYSEYIKNKFSKKVDVEAEELARFCNEYIDETHD